MKGKRILKFVAGGVTAIACTGILLLSCSDNVTNPPPASTTSATLTHLFNESLTVPGWTEVADALFPFLANTLFKKINGGDYSYIKDSTLEAGFFASVENLQKSTSLGYFMMDYGTSANAKAQYDSMVVKRITNGGGVKVDMPGFTAATAVGSEVGGGITAYAHFDKFFIQMDVTGYSTTAEAVNDAVLFINKFKARIEQ